MKNKIKKIMIEKKHGAEDGAIILDQAHHGCAPDLPYGWCAPAIRDNNDGTFDIGEVWWDFANFKQKSIGVSL